MSVTIDFPAAIAARLAAGWGSDLSRAAKEALAVESYRADVLSVGQVAQMLDLSIDAADGFLKSRGAMPKYHPDDLANDLASIEKLRGNKAPAR